MDREQRQCSTDKNSSKKTKKTKLKIELYICSSLTVDADYTYVGIFPCRMLVKVYVNNKMSTQ